MKCDDHDISVSLYILHWIVLVGILGEMPQSEIFRKTKKIPKKCVWFMLTKSGRTRLNQVLENIALRPLLSWSRRRQTGWPNTFSHIIATSWKTNLTNPKKGFLCQLGFLSLLESTWLHPRASKAVCKDLIEFRGSLSFQLLFLCVWCLHRGLLQ